MDINKEAEEYTKDLIESKSAQSYESTWVSSIFIAGYNSKATQAKILQAQLDCLNKAKDLDILTVYNQIKENLKQLENE